MYYLNFHGLYKPTTKASRSLVRTELDRDTVMQKCIKAQKGMCFYCGDEVDMTSHLDHVIPVRYGGTNKLRNLVAACKSCNLAKSVDQIEITNQYTINSYLELIAAKNKWEKKLEECRDNPSKYYWRKRRMPKRVQLYIVYRADLFKEI